MMGREGRARSTGVTTPTTGPADDVTRATRPPTAVNQVEFHPFLYQTELLGFCVSKKVQLEAYSHLTRGHRLNHPVISQIASRHGRTPAQVLIRWSLQHGLVVIPKSIRPDRIRENAAVFDFELNADDMK